MYKYFLYSILISLFISSCANQRNSSDSWDKKRITTACDCADMAKDVFTEIINDFKKNPGLSMDSIMNSKEALWKPRFERCDEIEKERRKSETSSFEEELEQCESVKELKSLMDTLARITLPEVDWEIPENDSNIEICECLVAANSEEEALQCAPDKTIDELMEMLTSDCMEMAEARYQEEYPVEEPTEEGLEPPHEIESEEITEESSEFEDEWEDEWEHMSPTGRLEYLRKDLYWLKEAINLLPSDIEYLRLKLKANEDSLVSIELKSFLSIIFLFFVVIVAST